MTIVGDDEIKDSDCESQFGLCWMMTVVLDSSKVAIRGN